MSTPKSVIDKAKKQGAKMVDVKFVDTFGTWQHFSCPIAELTEEVFAEGFGFDGSSIRGWKSIEASDMLAMPDPDTAFGARYLQALQDDPAVVFAHRDACAALAPLAAAG